MIISSQEVKVQTVDFLPILFIYYDIAGIYKPRVRCYDVSQMSMKFERCMDAEVVKFCVLSEDYTKVNLHI